jgi:hypothetical protein
MKQLLRSFVRWMGIGMAGGIFMVSAAQAQAEQNPMQGQKPVPMVSGEFRFVPGSWGLYKLKSADDPQEYKMWFAILDEVKQPKGKAYWMEIEVYTNDQPAVVTRVLVPDTGEGPGDALKAYVQIAGYRPFEVPRKYLKTDPKKTQGQVGQFTKYDLSETPAVKSIQWKGRKLMATTVDATDAQGKPTQITISMEAPPLCVVKLDSPQAKMELLDWGTNAKTKIVGKPVGLWRWVWGVAVQAAAKGGD